MTEILKKDLHFARISGKIVKLIILIPYFTLGGASTMAKCECCVKAVVDGSPKYVYACSRCLRAGKVTRAV